MPASRPTPPAPPQVGAQVILLKNQRDNKRLVNGSRWGLRALGLRCNPPAHAHKQQRTGAGGGFAPFLQVPARPQTGPWHPDGPHRPLNNPPTTQPLPRPPATFCKPTANQPNRKPTATQPNRKPNRPQGHRGGADQRGRGAAALRGAQGAAGGARRRRRRRGVRRVCGEVRFLSRPLISLRGPFPRAALIQINPASAFRCFSAVPCRAASFAGEGQPLAAFVPR